MFKPLPPGDLTSLCVVLSYHWCESEWCINHHTFLWGSQQPNTAIKVKISGDSRGQLLNLSLSCELWGIWCDSTYANTCPKPRPLSIIYMRKQSHIAIQWVEVGHINKKLVLHLKSFKMPVIAPTFSSFTYPPNSDVIHVVWQCLFVFFFFFKFPIRLCIYLCLSMWLSIYLSVCLSVYLSICLSVCLSVSDHVCLSSIHPSIYPSIHPSVCPSVHLSVWPCLSSIYLSVCLTMSVCHLSIHPSLRPSVCQAIIQWISLIMY